MSTNAVFLSGLAQVLHVLISVWSFSCELCAAIVAGGKGTAQDKIKALREAGVTVVESPAKIGSTMFEIFKQRGMVE
jgi:hypothetical protein